MYWDGESSFVARFNKDMMAPFNPINKPPIALKDLNNFFPGQTGEPCHQATLISWTVTREGSLRRATFFARSLRVFKQPVIASLMFFRASSTVSPCEWQPLIAGHETTYPPSASFSMTTLNFILFLPVLDLLMDLTLPEVMSFFQVVHAPLHPSLGSSQNEAAKSKIHFLFS